MMLDRRGDEGGLGRIAFDDLGAHAVQRLEFIVIAAAGGGAVAGGDELEAGMA